MKKPHIYQHNKLYHCRFKDKLTVGHTPKQALTAMQWLRNKPIIIDDTLLVKEHL